MSDTPNTDRAQLETLQARINELEERLSLPPVPILDWLDKLIGYCADKHADYRIHYHYMDVPIEKGPKKGQLKNTDVYTVQIVLDGTIYERTFAILWEAIRAVLGDVPQEATNE